MDIRDIPGELWQIVSWAKKPVTLWTDGETYIVYYNESSGWVEVCIEAEWKARDGFPVLVGWENGKLVFVSAA